MTPALVVALDLPDLSRALETADRLKGVDCWFKVGLELFSAEGPHVVTVLKEHGRRVFLDLKFLDIPNTVRGAVRSATRLGADMLTLHLSGGPDMAEAALLGRADGAEEGQGPLLVGVTVLTSQAQGPGSSGEAVDDRVLRLAQQAKAWYLDGVVCSGLEAPGVRALVKDRFALVTPGIRPLEGSRPELPAGAVSGQGVPGDDQRRVTTPAQAVLAGADYLVVGRPIVRAPDPAAAAAAILEEMAQANAAEE